MRSEAELHARVQELLDCELEKLIELETIKLPHNCQHNYKHHLDVRKSVTGEPNKAYNRLGLPVQLPVMGLCMYGVDRPEEWRGDICEDPIDAQRCPLFTPRKNREELTSEFYANLKDPFWVEEHLPEVSGLLWALGIKGPPRARWWQRFLLRATSFMIRTPRLPG